MLEFIFHWKKRNKQNISNANMSIKINEYKLAHIKQTCFMCRRCTGMLCLRFSFTPVSIYLRHFGVAAVGRSFTYCTTAIYDLTELLMECRLCIIALCVYSAIIFSIYKKIPKQHYSTIARWSQAPHSFLVYDGFLVIWWRYVNKCEYYPISSFISFTPPSLGFVIFFFCSSRFLHWFGRLKDDLHIMH